MDHNQPPPSLAFTAQPTSSEAFFIDRKAYENATGCILVTEWSNTCQEYNDKLQEAYQAALLAPRELHQADPVPPVKVPASFGKYRRITCKCSSKRSAAKCNFRLKYAVKWDPTKQKYQAYTHVANEHGPLCVPRKRTEAIPTTDGFDSVNGTTAVPSSAIDHACHSGASTDGSSAGAAGAVPESFLRSTAKDEVGVSPPTDDDLPPLLTCSTDQVVCQPGDNATHSPAIRRRPVDGMDNGAPVAAPFPAEMRLVHAHEVPSIVLAWLTLVILAFMFFIHRIISQQPRP